jgi:high-affinity Fe2+/Pb2+ permease
MPNVFAPQIFFIVFRETLETSIVVSVLLSFVKQQLGKDEDRAIYKKLRNQVSQLYSIVYSVHPPSGSTSAPLFYL